MLRSALPGRPRALTVAGVAALSVALLAGCGGDDDTSGTTTTASVEDTTTTEAEPSTTVATGAGSDEWRRTAAEHRGEIGRELKYECPAGGSPGNIWGTETYTIDSSVCTAGVHVGLITTAAGGTVTIEIQPGEALYDAGEANGVTSQYYGSFDGSFTFPEAPPGSGDFTAPTASWSQTAINLVLGDTRALECSANGLAGSVWGTGTFTADSSICTAAVHEGLITLDGGGTVRVDVVDGAESYTGSTANGVTSLSYPPYSLSFVFPADQPGG